MMKLKNTLLILSCLLIGQQMEAQILKKLKKKAENAVERVLAKKTDSIASKKTEQALDSLSKKDKPRKIASKEKKTTKRNGSEDQADLHLQASVKPEATQIGGTVTFTYAVNNKGPATSNNIVSKIHIPSSYSITSISVSQGNYDKASKLWNVGSLNVWSRAKMTVMVVVTNDSNLMTTGEIMNCSTKDPDSTPGNGIDTNDNGNIIDDKGDEDDGDGQDVKIGEVLANTSNNNSNSNNDIDNDDSNNDGNSITFNTDIKMVMEQKRDKMISYLDFDTMAMRMEDHSKGKKNDPIYWDKDGYIYSGEKGNYYKIPFSQVKNMGKNMIQMFTGPIEGMPYTIPNDNGKSVDLEWYEKPIIYNGHELYVSPNRYPMIEWVFIYHPFIFKEADDVKEESVPCRGELGCTRFTVTKGESIGSIVLFDSKGRLAEITNPDGAKAIYTYEAVTVKLPNAKEYNFPFKN